MRAALGWTPDQNWSSVPAEPFKDSEETRLRKLSVSLQFQLRQANEQAEKLAFELGETRDELADAYSLLGQAQQRIQDLSCALLSAQGGQP
jgi:hypothetical protein